MKKFIFISFILAASQIFSATLDVAKAKSTVEFLAVGQPSALRIRGKATNDDKKAVTGSLGISANTLMGTVKVALEALDTGISMRDRHMKEKYLEVGKYPEAELTITKLNLPASHSGENLPFEGQLSLHGVKKPVNGTATVEKKGSDLSTKFDFKIHIKDYGIEIPSYMGIKVADEVTINAATEGTVQ